MLLGDGFPVHCSVAIRVIGSRLRSDRPGQVLTSGNLLLDALRSYRPLFPTAANPACVCAPRHPGATWPAPHSPARRAQTTGTIVPVAPGACGCAASPGRVLRRRRRLHTPAGYETARTQVEVAVGDPPLHRGSSPPRSIVLETVSICCAGAPARSRTSAPMLVGDHVAADEGDALHVGEFLSISRAWTECCPVRRARARACSRSARWTAEPRGRRLRQVGTDNQAHGAGVAFIDLAQRAVEVFSTFSADLRCRWYSAGATKRAFDRPGRRAARAVRPIPRPSSARVLSASIRSPGFAPLEYSDIFFNKRLGVVFSCAN